MNLIWFLYKRREMTNKQRFSKNSKQSKNFDIKTFWNVLDSSVYTLAWQFFVTLSSHIAEWRFYWLSLFSSVQHPWLSKDTQQVSYYSVFQGFSKAKSANGGSILSLSQFLILPQLPQKIKLVSKVVKVDSKIIISLPKI